LSNTLDVVVMKRHASVIGSHTGLWTMMLGAGTAAGATWVVDDGGADFVNMPTAEAAA